MAYTNDIYIKRRSISKKKRHLDTVKDRLPFRISNFPLVKINYYRYIYI